METYSMAFSCDHCGEQISHMTKSLQTNSTAELWKKHGSCCVSCVSQKETFKPDKITGDSETISNPENKIISQNRVSGLEDLKPSELTWSKTAETTESFSNERVQILCGKIISAIGIISVLSFFYIELNMLAFAGVPLTLSGVAICRIGVRKKRFRLKMNRAYIKKIRPKKI